MKSLAYRGTATVREISSADIDRAWGIEAEGITVDVRVSRLVTVSDDLASRLVESGEFANVHDIVESSTPVESVTEEEEPVAPPSKRAIKDSPQA